MKEILGSKNIKNSLWNFADIFIYPILFFSTTSIFIDKLGEEEFGVWMLVNSIMITMQLFNLGLGTATFKNVALHLGKKDFKSVAETINTNLSLTFLVHFLCIVLGIFLSIGIKSFSLFNIQNNFKNLASNAAILAGVIVGLKFYEQIISFYFKAAERFEIATLLNTGTKLLILVVNVILIFFDYGLIAILCSTIIISILGIAAGIVTIKNQISGYKFSIHYKKESIKKELNFAIWTWFQSLAIVVTFQLDRFFVVTFFGLATITYYGLVATIFNHIHMGFNSIVPWLAPKVTKLKSQNKSTEELYFTSRNLCVALGLISLLFFHFINPPFLKLVLGSDKYYHIDEYIRWFTIFEMFFVYSIVPNYYLNAAGFEKLLFYIVIGFCSMSILGMLAGYLLVHSASGIIAGLSITMAISMFFQNWMIAKSVFNRSGFLSSLIFIAPAIFFAVVILIDNVTTKLFLVIVALPVYYFVFNKINKINFSLIKFDEPI